MRLPLAVGYTFVALMTVSLISLIWLIDLIPFPSWDAKWSAILIIGCVLLFSYAALWLWMLCDHLLHGGPEYAALISVLLIFGGGVAGLAYFFLVFRPRLLSETAVTREGEA